VGPQALPAVHQQQERVHYQMGCRRHSQCWVVLATALRESTAGGQLREILLSLSRQGLYSPGLAQAAGASRGLVRTLG
jgi:hypothetical protein